MSEAWPPVGRSLNAFGGDWVAYRGHLYAQYSRDFLDSQPSWPIGGKRFAIKKQPLVDGQCHTFWHIITEGDVEDDRSVALRRCECIGWPRLIVDEFNAIYPRSRSDRIVWWIEARGSKRRFHIALADFSYLVVIEDREGYVLLWTAYPIERDHQRRRKERASEQFWDEQAKAKAAP